VFLLAAKPENAPDILVRVLLDVDDMLIAAADVAIVLSIKAFFKFTGKDLGPCTYVLQMVVQGDARHA
jgi:hypothetical protein